MNLYGFPDIVPSVIDYRNAKPTEQFRPSGFSSEPGIYIYMLGWMLVFLMTNATNISSSRRIWLLLLTGFVIVITSSSQIVSVLLAIFLYIVFYSSKKTKFIVLFLFVIITSVIALYLDKYNISDQVNYILFDKVFNYFSVSTHTLDSGSFRSFTSRIGIAIFNDYPWGVGAGLSYFYMSTMKIRWVSCLGENV